MPSPTTPLPGRLPLSIDRLKRTARRQQRAQALLPDGQPPQPLMHIQNEVARAAGFQHWHHALRCLNARPLNEEPCDVPDVDRWAAGTGILTRFTAPDQQRLITALRTRGSFVVIEGDPGDGQKFHLFEWLPRFDRDRLSITAWLEPAHAATFATLWPTIRVLDQATHPDPGLLADRLSRMDSDVVMLGNLSDTPVWQAAVRLVDAGVQVLGYTNAPGRWPPARHHPRLVRVRPTNPANPSPRNGLPKGRFSPPPRPEDSEA